MWSGPSARNAGFPAGVGADKNVGVAGWKARSTKDGRRRRVLAAREWIFWTQASAADIGLEPLLSEDWIPQRMARQLLQWMAWSSRSIPAGGISPTRKEGDGSTMRFYWGCTHENMRRFGAKLLTRGGSACLNRARQCRIGFLAGGCTSSSLTWGLAISYE